MVTRAGALRTDCGSATGDSVDEPAVSCSAAASEAPPPLETLEAITSVFDGCRMDLEAPRVFVTGRTRFSM
jgi:hypothetical protein